MAYFMYVSLQRDDKIAIFEMDPASGKFASARLCCGRSPGAPGRRPREEIAICRDEEIRKISGYLALE